MVIPYITPKQAADRAALSTATIYRYVRDGTLPAEKIGRKKIMIPADAVDSLRATVEPTTTRREAGNHG
jgi:excisionase family DNA binding protein